MKLSMIGQVPKNIRGEDSITRRAMIMGKATR